MPIIDWKVKKNETLKDKNIFSSAYFVINTGFKSLIKHL